MLRERDPTLAPGVDPRREGDLEGERELERPEPLEREEDDVRREEERELARADPFPEPLVEPRPPLLLRTRCLLPPLPASGLMWGIRQLSPARHLPRSQSEHGALCS